MGFIISEGCCGLTLQTSCLIIGIVYLAMNIISCLTSVFTPISSLLILEPLLFICFSICLIVGAVNEQKGLLIPWMVGFAITCFSFIMVCFGVTGAAVIVFITPEQHPHKKIRKRHFFLLFVMWLFYLVKLVVEIVLFCFVLSYYKHLDGSN